ncbi:hypothetical protein PAL_GLEAN10002906 [Pteropus alecto]|uniref:Uncharacterized protein n=1 Tax=Pteropus alecto TaxID=9402 RepID=L5JVT3_PTEAL|nr:hypothetical protein PAL_GLEAN10002906 [Pteropus alecto]
MAVYSGCPWHLNRCALFSQVSASAVTEAPPCHAALRLLRALTAASISEKPRTCGITAATASGFVSLTWDDFRQGILKTSDSGLEA